MDIIRFHELDTTLVLRLGIVMFLGYGVVSYILVFFIFGDENLLKTG